MSHVTLPPSDRALASVAARSYLDRLTDLLPAGEARRARSDVTAMILDRVDALCGKDPSLDPRAAEVQALEALGSPDVLAEGLADHPMQIPWATVRAFKRSLWILVPCHLLLAIVLTVVGAEPTLAKGLLGPLTTASWATTILSVLTIALVDVGALVLLFYALGRRPRGWRTRSGVPLASAHREPVASLIMLGLLALIANVFLRRLFTLDFGGGSTGTFISDHLLGLVPYVNLVLGTYAVRDVLTLTGAGGARAPLLADAAATLGGAALMLVAASLPVLVVFPEHVLGAATATLLNSLVTKMLLLLLLLGALGALARGLRLLWQVPRVTPDPLRA